MWWWNLNDIEIEKLEKKYFEYISTAIEGNIFQIIDGLNSRLDLLKDWKTQFMSTSRKGTLPTDLDTGAERIFHHVLAPLFNYPNSLPIGSDLVYRYPDSVIHIDIKTVSETNRSDYIGKIEIGNNQTSYIIPGRFVPNLPFAYNDGELFTTTYAIYLLHRQFENVLALELVCIPNGQLYSVYGKDVFQAGKSGWGNGKDIRYAFKNEPRFKLLSNENETHYRVRIIALDSSYNVSDVIPGNVYKEHPKFMLDDGKVRK